MKKIGFVDYYLSEWHANNYPAWIREACAEKGLDYEIAYAWAELDASPLDGVTTDQWCAQFGVTRCQTLEELCERSDVILVLAPTNPEKHLLYARVILPYGKRTYIDKTFAPDLAGAKEIFALAERYHTPFFSTSALRYATELAEYPGGKHLSTTGSGRTFDEYSVHQVEMIVKKLGVGAKRVRAFQTKMTSVIEVAYEDERSATMTYAVRGLPFTAYMAAGDGRPVFLEITSKYFELLMRDIVRFFEEGTVSFDMAETLEVMRVRDGSLCALNTPGTWIEL